MRRLVYFLMILLTFSNCTYALKQYDQYERGGVIILCDRVGEVIDADEREQFGLFWGAVGFQSAVLYDIVEGGYVLEVITKDDNYVVVNRDPLGIDILRDYVDRNEEARKSKDVFEEKWSIVDYDMIGLPVTQYEMNSVKESGFTVGCSTVGTISTLLLGGIVLYFAALVAALSEGHTDVGWIIFAVAIGLPTGIAGSIMAGLQADRDFAVKRIKEARMPKAIE